jgi:hypothetical protein
MVSHIADDHINGVVALIDELAECRTDSRVPLDRQTGKSPQMSLAGNSLFLLSGTSLLSSLSNGGAWSIKGLSVQEQ